MHNQSEPLKPKNFKGTFKKVLYLLKPYKVIIFISLFLAIISAAAAIFSPSLIGNATDLIIEHISTNNKDFADLISLLITLLIIVVISLLAAIIEGVLMSKISKNISYGLRKDLVTKINKLPLKYFDKTNNGEVINYVTNDVDTLTNSFVESLTQVLSSFVTVVGVLIMMLRINVLLTLIFLIIIPIGLFCFSKIMKKSQKLFKKNKDYVGHINGYIEETYSGHNEIVLYNKEEECIKEMEKLNNVIYETSWKSNFIGSFMQPIMNFLGNTGYIIGCMIGGLFVIKGKMTIGNIQAFIQYAKRFNQPLANLAAISTNIQQALATTERIYDFLGEKEEFDNIKDTLDTKTMTGKIKFEHVNFGYNENDLVIKDLNLEINPGQKIAIVGPTGAGKTTIVKLLMNFYDLSSGTITIDGKNIDDLSKENIREAISMVLQDTWLFSGSIKDNISYGKQNATIKEIEEASKLSHSSFFIDTLPKGLDFMINEDVSNISDGEKQLLTIARSILKDSKILILDEATSSIDTRTEKLVQEGMNYLMKNRTCLIIAHRLSTIINSDIILVVKDGNIIEIGNHQELMDKKGYYAELYNSQFANT